ncbi:hypothetical protein FP803_02895 [Candidatus Woesearchaeota archaeon]|nr:hypothetical protein [Candidatus Woesearchaeota archaeon]MBU3942036.1 hypothetical protein [Nanoarchaeota archaeon]
MSFNYGGIGYYRPDYFCGILPKIYESRHEFKIGSSTNKQPKKDNIESKLKEEGTVRGQHIHSRHSTEGNMQNYRY